MADDTKRAALYAQLRQAFLSRHFAIGRYFRTDHFAEHNALESPLSATDLAALPPERQLFERWKRTRDTDNPLLMGSMLLTCIAVEDLLGHPHAPRILHGAVATFRSLYKFSGNHFDGYPLRWDPTCSDRWLTSGGGLVRSKEFLVDAANQYVFCSPSTDPRHCARRSYSTLVKLMGASEADRYMQPDDKNPQNDGLHYFDQYRRWEPSMDELVGLIASYSVIARLSSSSGTRAEVVRQASNLGDYLAEHGWLLVRPRGGLTARGATGILPALAYPLNRALSAITGRDYSARTGFQGAMTAAGYWKCLEGAIDEWTVIGAVAGPLLAPFLSGVIANLGLFAFVPEAAPLAGVALPVGGIPASLAGAAIGVLSVPMARAYAVYQASDCFDVKNLAAAQEVAAAQLLMENVPAKLGFQGWIFGAGFSGGKDGGWSAGFPDFLALTAIDDPDTTVRDAYLGWLAERHEHKGELEPGDRVIAEGCFPSALAVLLGAGPAEEANLVQLLDDRYAELTTHDVGKDLPLKDGPLEEIMHPAMDYLVGLALAWWHAKRRADAGAPVTTPGFPALPSNILFWPEPTVPASVMADVTGPSPTVTLPITAIDGTPHPIVSSFGAELFGTDDAPIKPDPPAPSAPPSPTRWVYQRRLPVGKNQGDVPTGIMLRSGDEYAISAIGRVNTGDLLQPTSTPDGWSDIRWDAGWPLFGALDPVNAHSNSLLGRLGGYFFVGSNRARERFLYDADLPLWLRINSDNPGHGSGAYQVEVDVWSAAPQSLRERLTWHGVASGRVSDLTRAVGLSWPPPPAVSLRTVMLG